MRNTTSPTEMGSRVTGKGRVVGAGLAAVVLGSVAAIADFYVSDLCFHNVAGSVVAEPGSERGSWCESVAPFSAWEFLLIAAAALLGVVIAMLPGPRWLRIGIWSLALLALIALPIYMGQLGYTRHVI